MQRNVHHSAKKSTCPDELSPRAIAIEQMYNVCITKSEAILNQRNSPSALSLCLSVSLSLSLSLSLWMKRNSSTTSVVCYYIHSCFRGTRTCCRNGFLLMWLVTLLRFDCSSLASLFYSMRQRPFQWFIHLRLLGLERASRHAAPRIISLSTITFDDDFIERWIILFAVKRSLFLIYANAYVRIYIRSYMWMRFTYIFIHDGCKPRNWRVLFSFQTFSSNSQFSSSTNKHPTLTSTPGRKRRRYSSRISKGIPTRRFLPFSALGHLSCTASLSLSLSLSIPRAHGDLYGHARTKGVLPPGALYTRRGWFRHGVVDQTTHSARSLSSSRWKCAITDQERALSPFVSRIRGTSRMSTRLASSWYIARWESNYCDIPLLSIHFPYSARFSLSFI